MECRRLAFLAVMGFIRLYVGLFGEAAVEPVATIAAPHGGEAKDFRDVIGEGAGEGFADIGAGAPRAAERPWLARFHTPTPSATSHEGAGERPSGMRRWERNGFGIFPEANPTAVTRFTRKGHSTARLRRTGSLVAQGHERIDFARTPGGKIAC